MSEPKKPLSLGEVARRLDDAGIAWTVFAGAAAGVYGAARPLTDVDILISAFEGERVATLFPEGQVVCGEDGVIMGIQLPGLDIVIGLTGNDADVTYCIDLDCEMLARRTDHQVAGVTAPVISPEDNILLKALWGRGPEVGKHGWEDVQAMMVHLPTLDWEYLRWRAEACRPRERVRQLLKRLERLWQQGLEDRDSR